MEDPTNSPIRRDAAWAMVAAVMAIMGLVIPTLWVIKIPLLVLALGIVWWISWSSEWTISRPPWVKWIISITFLTTLGISGCWAIIYEYSRDHINLSLSLENNLGKAKIKNQWFVLDRLHSNETPDGVLIYLHLVVSKFPSIFTFTAHDVRAKIISIKYYGDDGKAAPQRVCCNADLDMTWNQSGREPTINLSGSDSATVGLAFSHSASNKLYISGQEGAEHYQDAFNEIGVYKIELKLTGEDVDEKHWNITVPWRGALNFLDGVRLEPI
jgi:hypothetical protein